MESPPGGYFRYFTPISCLNVSHSPSYFIRIFQPGHCCYLNPSHPKAAESGIFPRRSLCLYNI
ncbi:hypothetical protein B9R42_04295 [Arthrospira platensis PCC 7345]|nr:MAG: hypothetical protein EA414_07775 [Arthrospira sp. PLM2.Bin9]